MIMETEGRRIEATPLTSPMCHSPHVSKELFCEQF
jgi:hypothetical protein